MNPISSVLRQRAAAIALGPVALLAPSAADGGQRAGVADVRIGDDSDSVLNTWACRNLAARASRER